MLDEIRTAIRSAAQTAKIQGKCGRKLLQPLIARELERIGFEADTEDTKGFLRAGLPAWRDKNTGQIELTRGRRRVDIVAYRNAVPVALVETESDLNDLRVSGVTNRNGHYDVFSIARSADGSHFHSYKSLERMAAAVFYSRGQRQGHEMATDAADLLAKMQSDFPSEHNPEGLGLFLVSGNCRASDRKVLEHRLRSLSAELICCTADI